MQRELTQVGDELLVDDTLRCLVVSGDGPSVSAGIEAVEGLAAIAAYFANRTDHEDSVLRGLRLGGTFEWIPRLACPSVAAVQGHGYGAGLQLALACDFRIFAESARVGLVETRYGLLPDMGATFRLPRLAGEGRARQLILLSEVIDAAEARRIGLADRVVADQFRDVDGRGAERQDGEPAIETDGARGEARDLPGPLPEQQHQQPGHPVGKVAAVASCSSPWASAHRWSRASGTISCGRGAGPLVSAGSR